MSNEIDGTITHELFIEELNHVTGGRSLHPDTFTTQAVGEESGGGNNGGTVTSQALGEESGGGNNGGGGGMTTLALGEEGGSGGGGVSTKAMGEEGGGCWDLF